MILANTGFLPKEERSLKGTIYLGLNLFAILFILKIIYIGLLALLSYNDILKIPTNMVSGKLENYSPIIQFAFVSIYAPILEELIFRIGLKFSKWNFIISIIGLTYITLIIFFKLDWIYNIVISLLLSIIMSLIIKGPATTRLSQFWSNNRRKIFYGFLLAFGLTHLSNYDLTFELLIFSIIIILPHILGGFIFSYARLNSGIILAICLHGTSNGWPLLLSLITE